MQPKVLAGFLGALLFAIAAPAFAANSEFRVGSDGTFVAKNLTVMQVSGSAIYARAVWDQAFIRLTILTTASTQFVKNHGGAAAVGDIMQGDTLDVVGMLVPGSDTLQINASSTVDHSLNVEPKTLGGTITSVGSGTFTLTDKKLGAVTVSVGTSTITKGVRTIGISELKKGDKVLSVDGAYDYASKTLSATKLVVWQDPSVFKPRTFVGTVKTVPGSALPTSLIISTATEDYQVFLSSDAKVLNSKYATTEPSRFEVGDKVRFYGSIRQDNLANFDATILRDLNF